jgi:hypothetical protein
MRTGLEPDEGCDQDATWNLVRAAQPRIASPLTARGQIPPFWPFAGIFTLLPKVA